MGQGKRWVLLAPPGSIETRLLLAKASSSRQLSRIGNQTGGPVFLLLHTDNFERDWVGMTLQAYIFAKIPDARRTAP
jgi:hypothetical protein